MKALAEDKGAYLNDAEYNTKSDKKKIDENIRGGDGGEKHGFNRVSSGYAAVGGRHGRVVRDGFILDGERTCD